MKKLLGEILVAEGMIRKAQLDRALSLQKEHGARLGDVLIGEGYINYYKLYKAIAIQYNLLFVDLLQTPPLYNLIDHTKLEIYHKLRAIPWQKKGEKITIATAEISQELSDWAVAEYGQNYELAITSPYDIDLSISSYFKQECDDRAKEALFKKDKNLSAKLLFKNVNDKFLMGGFIAIFWLFIFFPKISLVTFLVFVNLFYFSNVIFKMALIAIGATRVFIKRNFFAPTLPADKDLPIYTILIPLFRESDIVPYLIDAIRKIDYPKSKLDVKLIVEEDDRITIRAIKRQKCPNYFQIIKVPYSLPQTKPKACNYAMQFARGRYICIYDAEDVPDPLQLKKVVAEFARGGDKLICLQASLNYYNGDENLLTKFFSIEYSAWFDFMLPGLISLGMPILLGGTSNHFKKDKLVEIGGWDPYNVTEDADIGLRIFKLGYKVGLIDSLTEEEAPFQIKPWIKQRSRWIKGHIQTYFVAMRNPAMMVYNMGFRGILGVQLFVGVPCLTFLLSPILWGIWIIALFSGGLSLLFPDWFLWIAYSNLWLGFLSQIATALIVVYHRNWWQKLNAALLFPFYWFLHPIASFKSVYELIRRPSYWEKTSHAVSKIFKTC